MKKQETVLVFAGDGKQFYNWLRSTFGMYVQANSSNIKYVSSYEQSLGYNDVIIFKIGTWYEHEWVRKAIVRLEHINEMKA